MSASIIHIEVVYIDGSYTLSVGVESFVGYVHVVQHDNGVGWEGGWRDGGEFS